MAVILSAVLSIVLRFYYINLTNDRILLLDLYAFMNVFEVSSFNRSQDMDSGGFRHVQHVRPNRGPTKRGPTKIAANFCMPEKWAISE